ncbi:MAG TPA: MFS transporter [Chloroflexota bacterium]|nr:MFS transporter [Chloroflexota bacterium]
MNSNNRSSEPSRVRWLVLAAVCGVYFVTYLDRVNISVAAPAMAADLHLSLAALGGVFSAFSLSYALLQIPGGFLGDKIGPRKALGLMGILWSIATAATAIPAAVPGLIGARFGLGVAEAGAFPTATRAFTAWIPSAKRGLAQGLPHSFARLGGALAPPVVIALVLAYGWRQSFLVLAVVSLAWVSLWWWFYRDRPRDHWLTNPAEVEMLDREAEPLSPGAAARTPWGPLFRRMLPVTIADFCYGWSLWVFLTWIPTYLSDARHFNLKQLALYATLPLIAGVVGDTVGGISSDLLWRRGHPGLARSGQVAVGLLLSLVFVAPAPFVSSPVTAVWLLSASFFCLELTNAPLWALAMDIGHEFAGVGGGMMNTGFGVAGIISPLVFGVLVQWTGNWALPFVVSSVLLLIGAGVTRFIDPVTPLTDAPTKGPPEQRIVAPVLVEQGVGHGRRG